MRSVRGLLSSSRSSAAWVSPPEPDFCALNKRKEGSSWRLVSLAIEDRSTQCRRGRVLRKQSPWPPEEKLCLVITWQRVHSGPSPPAQAAETELGGSWIKQDQGSPWHNDVDVHALWMGLYLSNPAEMRCFMQYFRWENLNSEKLSNLSKAPKTMSDKARLQITGAHFSWVCLYTLYDACHHHRVLLRFPSLHVHTCSNNT